MAKLNLVLNFLSSLQSNNNRDWMEKNKAVYKEAKMEFENFSSQILGDLIDIDDSLSGATLKECIFRINRDIRFSNDKSPYKTNFGAYLNRGGRHGASAGYYLHIQPNNKSMIGGGRYMPTPEELKAIRQEIDYNSKGFLNVINNPDFKDNFGKVQGEKLVKAPKGYSPENPMIEWLKLKNFYVMHTFQDEEVGEGNFHTKIIEIFKTMKPFNDFINSAILMEE